MSKFIQTQALLFYKLFSFNRNSGVYRESITVYAFQLVKLRQARNMMQFIIIVEKNLFIN